MHPDENELTNAVEELRKEAEALQGPGSPPSEPAQPPQAPSAEEDGDPIAVTLQVGYRKSGRPFLQVQGSASLLEIYGLLWYAEQELERLLQGRLQTPHPVVVGLEAKLAKLDELERLHKDLLDAIRALARALKERRK